MIIITSPDCLFLESLAIKHQSASSPSLIGTQLIARMNFHFHIALSLYVFSIGHLFLLLYALFIQLFFISHVSLFFISTGVFLGAFLVGRKSPRSLMLR